MKPLALAAVLAILAGQPVFAQNSLQYAHQQLTTGAAQIQSAAAQIAASGMSPVSKEMALGALGIHISTVNQLNGTLAAPPPPPPTPQLAPITFQMPVSSSLMTNMVPDATLQLLQTNRSLGFTK